MPETKMPMSLTNHVPTSRSQPTSWCAPSSSRNGDRIRLAPNQPARAIQIIPESVIAVNAKIVATPPPSTRLWKT